VYIEFEFLSVSYIISELFLISVSMMQQEAQQETEVVPFTPTIAPAPAPNFDQERLHYFSQQLPSLTPTERTVYNLYLSGSTSKEILNTLHITENTLKFHNKNIYSKLGISSRKQLKEMGKALDSQHN
jgi:DNA-binding CsgD family transcriptional regulator